MTDNRSLRHADRAPATFSDDDPLAELARIASEFEAAVPSNEREAANYSDDAMAFDLEAELMRSFESDAAHAHLAEEGNPAELAQDAQRFGEAANQDEPAREAPVSDLTPEEIPAFLKSRPAEDAAGTDEPAPEDAVDLPAESAKADETRDFATAEDVTVDDAPSAPRNDDIADEWTDLPEWPQARSSARRASPAEPIEKIDLGPPAPAAEPSVPEEPKAAEIEPEAVTAGPAPAAEPIAAVEPAPAPLPEDELPPPIERVSEEAHENHDIIRSFSDHHDDWAEIEEQEADTVEPTQWAEGTQGVDEPAASSANEAYAGDDPVDSDPIWRDFQNYAVPSQAAPDEPMVAAPAADPVDEWDIAADLESAFSDYDGDRAAASTHHDDSASEAYEPAVVEDISRDAPPAALVADEARWDDGDPLAEEADQAVTPVAHVPYAEESATSFEAFEPLDADEAVIGDVDAGYTSVEGEAALNAPAEADALRVDEDEMAAMAIDFDDLELEMQAVAATLGDEPALRAPEPTVVAESAPPAGEPVVATPPIAARQPEPAYAPAPQPAPQVVAAAAPTVAVAAPRESDLVFDTGDVADTSTFIEPVAALDIPDLPEVETPPAAAVDPDMSELEAEFADILATEPPQRAQAEPAPAAVNHDHNFDFANYEFADFESYPTNEARDGAGAAGAAAIPADLAFDDFENDAPVETADRSGGGDNRKWVLLAGGLVLLAGVSFAGYAFMGGSGTEGGAPPVIAANDEPYKVVPEDPGGRAVPNQDQAVYDRVAGRAGDGNANLVSRTEEPIDVVQRTLDPQVLPLEGRPADGDPAALEMPPGEPPAEAAAPQATTVDGLLSDAGVDDSADTARFGLEPRVVSTMVVRPDGTLVPADSLDANADGAPQETASAGNPAPAAPLDDPEARLAPATEIEDLLAPPRSVETTTLTPDGQPAATEPAAPAAPEQETVSAEPNAGTETAATGGLVGEGAAFSNPGGYVVQIASQPSAESARSTYQSLSGRYASIIGDRQAQIQAADIPDRGTFYRVRVAGGTRDEAVALCERYQAAGGSCFVAQ